MLSFPSLSRVLLLFIFAKETLGQGSDSTIDPTGTEDGSSGFKWITPTPGASMSSGQSLLATWRSSSDYPISNPSFALCTPSDECGEASWPNVVNNDDGSSSATLSLPPVNDGMSGLYLKMKSDDQNSYHSPKFNLGIDTVAPNSVSISDIGGVTTASSIGTKTRSNPYYWGTPTTGVNPAGSDLTAAGTAVLQSVISIPTYDPNDPNSSDIEPTYPVTRSPTYHTKPTQTRLQTQTQIPFAYPTTLPASPYTNLNASANINPNTNFGTLQTNPTLLPAALSSLPPDTQKVASRPNAVAIAVPLSACGIILLAALIFCARKKGFRAPGWSGSGSPGGVGRGDEERGWEKVVKEKAAAAAVAGNGVGEGGGGKGVSVIERKDEEGVNPYRFAGNRQGEGVLGVGYRSGDVDRERSPRSGSGEAYRSRCLTPVRDCERERDRYGDERFTTLPRVNYSRRSGGGEPRSYSGDKYYEDSRRGYYTTSRRSGSSLGWWNDDEWDIRPKPYSTHPQHRIPSRECVDRGCMNRERQGSNDSNGSRSSIYNPHPPTPTSRESRPLPTPCGPPLIRTPSMYTTGSDLDWRHQGLKGKEGRASGGLERGWSEGSTVTHTGWEDRVGYAHRRERGEEDRRGRERPESLDEVYESLRRAIGTPR